jgi:hypothetical protein
MISAIFEQFIQETPVTVMVRGIMERIFEPQVLNDLFERYAVKQYTRELLFSNVVSLMNLVLKIPLRISSVGSFRTKLINPTTLENNSSLVYCDLT